MITFTEFRREFIAIIKCAHDRVVPINIVPRNTLTVEEMIGIRTSAAIIRKDVGWDDYFLAQNIFHF
jgi:hypothetical protein